MRAQAGRDGRAGPARDATVADEPAGPAFGSSLRRHRLAAGLTQEELAARAGLSARTVSDLERGVHATARRDTARLLAEALGLPTAERAGFARLAAGRPSAIAAPLVPDADGQLPIPPTPLVGRDGEAAAVTRLLRSPEVRLLTLTGPGGVGKTRLALRAGAQLAEDFADGVTFVDLSGVREPALVLPTVAQTLGLRGPDDESMRTSLAACLRGARLLLLDNFEQVLPAAPALSALLSACADLKVLVTSRAALRLRAEQEYPVQPLGLPERGQAPPAAALSRYPAVRLFIQRATAADPATPVTDASVAAAADICVRLDGLPLAIELAAARARELPLPLLMRRLGSRLALLTRGPLDAPARQQTLRRTMEWSYELLDPDAQALLRRLAVFVGGWTLDAAERVCGLGGRPDTHALDLLSSLADHSLVRRVDPTDDSPRYAMLETVREYALERLAADDDAHALRRRHAAYYLGVAERAEPRLSGPEQIRWLDRLEAEHGNLRAALETSVAARDVPVALRLGAALWRFWETRGYVGEGRAWLDVLVASSAGAPVALRAQLRNAAGNLARDQGDLDHAAAHLEASRDLWRAAGDRRGLARSLNNLGNVALDQGRYEQAAGLYEEALAHFRALDDPQHVALASTNLGIALHCRGLHVAALRMLRSSLALSQRRQDRWQVARTLACVADVLTDRGRTRWAARLYEQSLGLRAEVGDRHGIAVCLEGLAAAAVLDGAAHRGVRLFGAAEALRDTLGEPPRLAERVVYARGLTAARAALGPDAFAAEWAAGRELSWERALVYATIRPVGAVG